MNASLLPWDSPCNACTDETCGPEGCPRYALATKVIDAAARLADVLRELELSPIMRQRAATSVCDAISEALGACGGRLEREPFLLACGYEAT
jgi:hypothetical protein